MANNGANDFGLEMLQLLRLLQQGETVRIPLESRKEAVRLRFMFYQWRQTIPATSEYRNLADGVMLSVDERVASGVELVFLPKSKYSNLLMEGLNKALAARKPDSSGGK